MIGEPTLPAVASLGPEPVDEIHHVVEPATDPGADAASGDDDGKVGLTGAGPADQHGVALPATGEVTHERLVDRRTLELEVVEVLGERQVLMLLLASALGGFSIWMLLSELPRSGVQRLPINSDAAAIAATARGRAAWAAAFGGVRGDLWAESAFTYATLHSPGPAPDADPSTIANQARTVIERALACAPYESSVWLLATRLAFRFNWTNANPIATLKMSYYTGLNELHLIPLRLFTATHSNALSDHDLQQLVQRDIRMILTHWPELRPTLAAAYKDAEPEAKQCLEGVVAETDPGFLQTMRANILQTMRANT